MALTENPSAEIPEKLARIVFTSPNTRHTVQDILDFAWFLGVLQPLAREAQLGRARQEGAAAQGLEADLAEITRASDEFRYERDLLTAEEAEAWLAARDVSQLQFSDSFTRKYWCARLEEPSEDSVPAPPYPDLAHRELMRAESIQVSEEEIDQTLRGAMGEETTGPEAERAIRNPAQRERARNHLLERKLFQLLREKAQLKITA